MNRFKEYLTVPFGVVEAEADEEAVLSIRLLRKGEAPEEGCESNLYTGLCLQQLKEFFAGDRKAFSFPYRLTGTDFQNGVWEEIAKIPYGETISCKELAERAGSSQNIAAVSEAAAANRLLFCIPVHRISDSALLPGFDGKLMAELQELEKKPTIFTKYNYYEEQLRRGMGRSNKITGRFLYDVGEALFELEEELVLNAGKTYTFPVSFDLSGCSGFALEGICDLESIPDDPAFQTGAYTAEGSVFSGASGARAIVTLRRDSNRFTTAASLSPGTNMLYFDINEMSFSRVSELSVSVTAPLRSLKLFKLNVLDNYFRYRGQEHFYTFSGGMLSEESYTLRCKLSGACELESPVFPDTSKSVYNMRMPRRNTVFIVLKNLSTAARLRLYYRTTLHPEYCEENSVEAELIRSPEFKAYYFNLSATPGCEGRLLQFKLSLSGSGDLILREYSFEEEKPFLENAGEIRSCIAQDEEITIKGCISKRYAEAGSVISVYATTMREESNRPEGKECVASVPLRHAASEGQECAAEDQIPFTVEHIPLRSGPITRLPYQFAAYLTANGRTIPLGERFYIENYMDFDSNPYQFLLPSYQVCATDAPYGAKGDACTDDTDAIQSAIDTVWKQGGGTVILPGTEEEENEQTKFYGRRYRITNLLLRSRVELHFEKGAVLWQSPVYRDYKYAPVYGHDMAVPNVNWTHCLHVANLPTIQCANSEYVKITGFGKIRSVDTGAEEGVQMPGYSTGCPDRIHQIPIGFYETKRIELRDFELVRTNNYHIGLYGCAYVYAANLKLHEVRCVSGDGFGLSKGSHHVALNRNFLQSNDDGVVLSGCYFDPRGLVWWKSRLGKHGGTRHVRIAHSYLNSGGGKALAFITWGTSDPNYEYQEISDITAYDNYLISTNPVGAWPDNPYNGKAPFDNSETDDYSPVKSVRIFNNKYEGNCTIAPIRATDFLSDCGICSADDFQNRDFCISRQPNLSNWSYKKNKKRDSVSVRRIGGKICGVMQYFKEGDTSLYQGLHLLAGAHKCTFEVMTGATGAYLFVQNIRTGEILAERHIISPEAFQSFELKFMLSEDSDLYLGVRHPADMTSEEDFTALQKASMESVER